jgi:urease accessory protein
MQSTLWQLIDSAFPSGGFAHSWGLEAAYQAGELESEPALRRFLRDNLWQTGHAVLPLVTAAHREPERFEALDADCDAFLSNSIANRASRQQGRAMLAACARIWPSPALIDLDARARAGHGHYPPSIGAALQALHIPIADAHHFVLFAASRGVLAAAIRLGIVGPFRAQQLQHDCARWSDDVLAACAPRGASEITQTAPIADLVQSAHDRLYSRLFQS